MVIKLTILCTMIVVAPVLWLIYNRFFRRLQFSGSFKFIPSLPALKKAVLRIDKRDSHLFEKCFEKHFHPSDGRFPDEELRGLVHEIYLPEVRTGKSYKQLWRWLNVKFSPSESGDKKLNEEERGRLSAYMKQHFTHYSDLAKLQPKQDG